MPHAAVLMGSGSMSRCPSSGSLAPMQLSPTRAAWSPASTPARSTASLRASMHTCQPSRSCTLTRCVSTTAALHFDLLPRSGLGAAACRAAVLHAPRLRWGACANAVVVRCIPVCSQPAPALPYRVCALCMDISIAMCMKLPPCSCAQIMDANKRRPDHPDYDPRTLHIPPGFMKVCTTPCMAETCLRALLMLHDGVCMCTICVRLLWRQSSVQKAAAGLHKPCHRVGIFNIFQCTFECAWPLMLHARRPVFTALFANCVHSMLAMCRTAVMANRYRRASSSGGQ